MKDAGPVVRANSVRKKSNYSVGDEASLGLDVNSRGHNVILAFRNRNRGEGSKTDVKLENEVFIRTQHAQLGIINIIGIQHYH